VATFTAKAASPDVRFTVDGEICCPAMFSYTTIQTQNDISMSENIEITTTHQGQQIHMQIFDTTGMTWRS
jgi:hypothetical protein